MVRFHPDDLPRVVKSQCTTMQRETIEKWETTGWHVYAAKQMDHVTVAFISHPDSTGPAVVYPDGDVQRAIRGKRSVEFNWKRARDAYAKATHLYDEPAKHGL